MYDPMGHIAVVFSIFGGWFALLHSLCIKLLIPFLIYFALIVVNFCNRSLGKWLCFREVLVCVDLHKGMVVNLVFEG